jgi:hypothetical protein
MDVMIIFWRVFTSELVDTVNHSFEVLLSLMESPECVDIIGDVGMPIIHVQLSNLEWNSL